jgi:hypothetical protein
MPKNHRARLARKAFLPSPFHCGAVRTGRQFRRARSRGLPHPLQVRLDVLPNAEPTLADETRWFRGVVAQATAVAAKTVEFVVDDIEEATLVTDASIDLAQLYIRNARGGAKYRISDLRTASGASTFHARCHSTLKQRIKRSRLRASGVLQRPRRERF